MIRPAAVHEGGILRGVTSQMFEDATKAKTPTTLEPAPREQTQHLIVETATPDAGTPNSEPAFEGILYGVAGAMTHPHSG